MDHQQIKIEDWDGDAAIRISAEVLQEMRINVGDTLYLLEAHVDSTRCLILSKTPQVPDRVDVLVEHWNQRGDD
ncbi:hypothetical protein SAMN05216271_0447 [Halopseudomonas sabulinigri]|uniref:AbrB/MazE/SpoVT family DNA-binding domain-containing protein n=1 Tax=Halopseudomonas sabulinigri TaxID=472181 RepID=A0A1H1M1C1_9GAMM|nr:hypothetical protein [Halopseudomonas sabulinigri]SDR80581.1 hypothetical protein SAMN05216271_0447 [Halopseudomonas sabulinigri]